MSKKILSQLMTCIMIVCLSAYFSSCSKDDSEDEFEPTENVSSQDPEGTIVLNMEGGASGNYYKIGELGEIHVDAANNFRGNDRKSYKIDFVTIGKVDGLSKVNQIPTSGWAESAAVIPGTGYMMRCYYSSSYSRENPQYVRIYVVDYLTSTYTDEMGNTYGSTSGATIKYQAPLQQKINLENSSLTFSNTGNVSKSIKLKTPTHLSVKEKPEWCYVTAYVDSVRITVSENLGESRNGDVLLSNVYGEATISISQNAIAPISFENSSITFSSEASTQNVKLKKSTNVELEEKPNWCTVQVSSEAIIVSVMENLSASQRTGKIVLKNAVGSASLDVIQKASSTPLFEKGMGTEEDPYQIKTAQQLENIGKSPSSHFVLTSDVDLKSYLYEHGNGWEPIAVFNGVLDGKGHTIKGLWMKRPSTDNIGLFSSITQATISNINIETDESGIIGQQIVGAICGSANSSTITGCSVKGDITGTFLVGGVFGYASSSNISICHVNGNIVGNKYRSIVGGVGGESDYNSKITMCYSEGGITGKNFGISIYGICGGGNISDCYSTATLSGNMCYGLSSQNVTRCYFAGKILYNGYDASNFYCNGTYTYFDSTVSNKAGNNGYSTADMMKQSTYESWDFKNTWKITEGKTYPTLRCFDK
ncbi:MAG: hypothetical protein II826_02105 [Prevotella sp.]|nr:hypothetical protein [Prevotella sp.]